MHTVTKTVIYRGCTLHARAVPHGALAGFDAEVLVCTAAGHGQEDRAVGLRPWLHGSAHHAIQYALAAGRDWVRQHAGLTSRPQ